MAIRLFQVDAFTSEPFAGNPAPVCLLPEPRADIWMQQVACEMNLSETAFLLEQYDGYSLRRFTPKVEVDLCGHATLAGAQVPWQEDLLGPGQLARFHTRSGLLTAERKGDGLIEIVFPATPAEPSDAPEGLLAALGVMPRYVGMFGSKHLIEVDSEETVRCLCPDFASLRAMPGRGVAVTSASASPRHDFVSRYFAPWVGIDEAPVTGSAHCAPGPFWGKRLEKGRLVAFQASERGGVPHIHLRGERILMGGQAVTISCGELLVYGLEGGRSHRAQGATRKHVGHEGGQRERLRTPRRSRHRRRAHGPLPAWCSRR